MTNDIRKNFLHLGLGSKATAEPEFTGLEWYLDYEKRRESDGAEGRLVSVYSFAKPWENWEMHPHGHEVVMCLHGSMTLVQETENGIVRTTLNDYEYAIIEPGVWHTADAESQVTALFITPGKSTEHKSR